jgi:DNA-binding winged helix-turn-helix (wHTH) protein/TolB-like protein/Flp pilus assembly protein TadD
MAGEKQIPLNAKAFDLLVFLVENAGRVLGKDEIMEGVWEGQFVEEANLTVQISTLRKALNENKEAPRFLVTVPGKGYKFVAEVERAGQEIIIEKHQFKQIVIDEEIDQPATPGPDKSGQWRERDQRMFLAGIGLILLALLGFFAFQYLYRPPKTEINSLAVLPFSNQTADPGTEYLSDGVAESIIHLLSGVSSLRVLSRNSSFRYREPTPDARKIGKELNVEAVLTGRIVLLGENISVRTELISAADNSVIWGDQVTGKFSDVEKLQAHIAQSISQKLQLKLSGADEKRLKKRQSENSEVYRLYLLGRFNLNKLSDEGFYKGRDYFQQAIDLDPQYAPAYAGLAESYNRLSGYNAISPNEGYSKARAAAEKALELDDQLAEAYATLGSVRHFYDWDWAGAEKAFKTALDINPNNSSSHQLYSYFLSSMGRFEEAIAEMRRARELDPLTLEFTSGIGDIYYYQRQYDLALEYYRKALEMEQNAGIIYWSIGNVHVQKGMYKEAIDDYQMSIPLSGGSPDEPASLAYALALSGKRGEALKILETLNQKSRQSYVSPAIIAVIYAGLGEKDRAFEWLEKAYQGRDMLLVLLKVEPIFDKLRDDPRFTELLKKMGLLQ